MSGEDRVLDLGDDGVVVADDPGQDALAARQRGEQVGAHLLAHGPHHVSRRPELPDRTRLHHHVWPPLVDESAHYTRAVPVE